jgi:hypothetical protein
LGIALALGSFALFATGRPAASGVVAGLLLGTRASYFPLVGSLLVLAWIAGPRLRVVTGLAGGLLAWGIPFFAIVGIGHFVTLGRATLAGHFGQWGGSVETRPDLVLRSWAFVRDVFYDGFAPAWWALLLLLGLVALAVWVSRKRPIGQEAGAWPPRFLRGSRVLGLVLAPYALWAFFGQNVIEQPRHALPLVEGLVVLLAGVFAAAPLALGLACVTLAGASLPLAIERHRLGPAPAQAAEWIRAHDPPTDTAVMTDRSWRFFTEMPGPYIVRQHAWLSEVIIDLTRFDRLPSHIVLTSEIDLHSGGGPHSPLPRRWSFEAGPTFCRDVRIDRAEPCLGLTTLGWSPR